MGMFDTIYFDKNYVCPLCGGKIESVQVKEFENILKKYRIKDCVAHAEDMRIVRNVLFCNKCLTSTGKKIYIVIGRGILLGITDTLDEATKLLNEMNLERIILWYHELYQRYMDEQREKASYRRFLDELHEWYSKRFYEIPEDQKSRRFLCIWNRRHFEGALSPVEAIERFITCKKLLETLNEVWLEGKEILEIYYEVEITAGEESWSVDIYQDDINERCGFNWTWKVISKKKLKIDGEKENELPDWCIVVDEPFSDEVVHKAVHKWLSVRGYEFDVKMIAVEHAKGSEPLKERADL